MDKRKFKSEQEAGGGDVDVTEGRRSQESRKGSGGGVGGCCQVENCGADLRNAKQYHRKHRVCEDHAKAQVILVSGIRQRFCQQCSSPVSTDSTTYRSSTSKKGAAGSDSPGTTSGGGSNPLSLPLVRLLPVGEWLVGRSTSRKMLHITNTSRSTK